MSWKGSISPMKKRLTAWLLLAALVAGLLSGCGDKNKEQTAANPGQTAATNSANSSAQSADDAAFQSKYTYKAEYIPLDMEDLKLDYINRYCISGDAIYLSGSGVVGKTVLTDEVTGEPYIDEATGEPMEVEEYQECLVRMDLTTKAVANLNFQPAKVPEGQQGSSNINAMAVGADGTLWVFELMNTYTFNLPEDFNPETDDSWKYYEEGESRRTLRQFDAEGKELQTLTVEADMDWCQDMRIDQNGNFYLNTGDLVYLLDSKGALLAEIPNDNYGEFSQIDAAQIGVVSYGEKGMVFKPIDPAAKGFGEKMELPTNARRLYPGFDSYTFLYDDYGDIVYGYNQETGESEKLLSLLDCDVSNEGSDGFTFLPDGRVVLLNRDYSAMESKYELIILTQVDPSTLPQKQELTLACMYLQQNMRNQVIQFNRNHDDIRIVVRDYSAYNTEDNYEAGLLKLNTELLSGYVPDLLCTDNLPLDQYAAKGLLTDLWPLIDNDGEISRDDLMSHLFDVMSIDGKLYQVVSSFYIMTAAGKADIIGDRASWTLEELLETMKELPEGAMIFGESDTKDYILQNCVSRNMEAFIDWDNKECHFDSQEFIDLLNFANSFPKEFDWESYDYETAESEYSRLHTGKQLLMEAGIYDFDYIQYIEAMVGGTPSFPGYPSSVGNGSAFGVNGGIAISAACQDQEAAWAFVREVLLEENQTSEYMWQFPTNRHAFEAYAKQKMTPEYEKDPETGEQVEVSHHSWGVDNDTMIDIYAMTQAQYDMFMDLYNSCSSLMFTNLEVNKIIADDVGPFFDGQKTAEETAAIIQNRVSLYVAEQG